MQLPVHVVVVDGTDLLQPGELAELLGTGPRYGIVGVTIDPRLAPEGLGATLTLTDAADLGRVRQPAPAPPGGRGLPEVAPAVAERAARRMASLRPATDDDGSQMGSVCHLVDIDRLGDITGDQLVERWRTQSPNSVATVGMSGDVPMRVDLVADGPHGLVGGTSGSGKTEFLKTLFLSLCVNNHPDDLSIVIVDFKGGVDHDAVRPLPHVIDVATNLDLDQFERTVSLLRAEQMRRQELLGRAGREQHRCRTGWRGRSGPSSRRCRGSSSWSTSSASCSPARAGASSSRSSSRSPASDAPSGCTCCSSRRTSRTACPRRSTPTPGCASACASRSRRTPRPSSTRVWRRRSTTAASGAPTPGSTAATSSSSRPPASPAAAGTSPPVPTPA